MHDIVVRLHPVGGRPNGARPKWAARSRCSDCPGSVGLMVSEVHEESDRPFLFFVSVSDSALGSNVDSTRVLSLVVYVSLRLICLQSPNQGLYLNQEAESRSCTDGRWSWRRQVQNLERLVVLRLRVAGGREEVGRYMRHFCCDAVAGRVLSVMLISAHMLGLFLSLSHHGTFI